MVVAGETSAGALNRRTGNYRSHTVIVCKENQGPWQINHEWVAHIRLTASEEYVEIMPKEDLG